MAAAAGRCLLSKHQMRGPRPAAALVFATMGVSRGQSEKFVYESRDRGDRWLFLAQLCRGIRLGGSAECCQASKAP